jgi:hypothetical protein
MTEKSEAIAQREETPVIQINKAARIIGEKRVLRRMRRTQSS